VSALYRHTQPGWVIGGPFAVVVVILALLPRDGAWIPLLPIAVIAALGLLIFGALTVEVDREAIRLRFGIGLVRKTVPLERVRSWRPVRNPWYVGWGIRLGPGYTLWNVSGLSAVELVLADGRRLRIGTDEPAALSRAIEMSAGHPPAHPADVPPVPSRSWKTTVFVVAAVVLVMALVIGVTFHLEMIPPRVTVSPRGFQVESVFYGQEYLWSDVTDIHLEPRLPRILARTNGFAAAGLLRGHFRVQGLGAGKLFVDFRTPPFVLVRLREGFVIVNLETAEKTRALYEELIRARPYQSSANYRPFLVRSGGGCGRGLFPVRRHAPTLAGLGWRTGRRGSCGAGRGPGCGRSCGPATRVPIVGEARRD
jgi:hypothetical protein